MIQVKFFVEVPQLNCFLSVSDLSMYVVSTCNLYVITCSYFTINLISVMLVSSITRYINFEKLCTLCYFD